LKKVQKPRFYHIFPQEKSSNFAAQNKNDIPKMGLISKREF